MNLRPLLKRGECLNHFVAYCGITVEQVVRKFEFDFINTMRAYTTTTNVE